MDYRQKSVEISESLNQPKWKGLSQIAKNIIAVSIAGIPYPGAGSVAGIIDKVGDHFLQPNIKDAVVKLAAIIMELAPEIEKLPRIEEQIGGLIIILEQNQILLKKLEAICEELNQQAPKQFQVFTDNSLQELIETTVKNMNVIIEAQNGGVNFLYKFKSEGGDVQFYSTGSSRQVVHRSVFEGDKGGTVLMDKLNIVGPIKAFHNERGSGIAFGPGGSVGFTKGGFLGFGKKEKDSKD